MSIIKRSFNKKTYASKRDELHDNAIRYEDFERAKYEKKLNTWFETMMLRFEKLSKRGIFKYSITDDEWILDWECMCNESLQCRVARVETWCHDNGFETKTQYYPAIIIRETMSSTRKIETNLATITVKW